MKRVRSKRRGGLSRSAEQLIWLANGLSRSSSRIEDLFWERQLQEALDEQLLQSDEDNLNTALDHLFSADARAYEELADALEFRTECAAAAFPDHDVVLIAAPILAWSRYRIPATSIPAAVLANLRVHLQAHVLARHARLALADFIFSPDQLPQGYCATAEFTRHIGAAAFDQQDLHIDAEALPESAQFLSDTRYLLAAVAVEHGAPLFRWQESDSSREQALQQWRSQGGACLTPLFPGCATELVLPEPYFAACRAADRDSRPYSVRASVAYLGTLLETAATQLRAVIAPFWNQRLEEYRIGFTLQDSEQVIHGVVWPLLGAEDEQTDIQSQIDQVLRECGIRTIEHLDHHFPLEYCDDCGTPMYPSPEGEAVHVEMPEEHVVHMPQHLH